MTKHRWWFSPGRILVFFTIMLVSKIAVRFAYEHVSRLEEDLTVAAIFGLCMGSLPAQKSTDALNAWLEKLHKGRSV